MSSFNSAAAIFSLAVVGTLGLLHFSMSFLVSSKNLLALLELLLQFFAASTSGLMMLSLRSFIPIFL